MKVINKVLSAILSVMIVGNMTCPISTVSAAAPAETPVSTQSEIQPRLSYIKNATATFLPSGDFTARITASSDVQSIDITVELQKKGVLFFSTVDTLSYSKSGSSAVYSDSFALDSSSTYRIKVTFEVFTQTSSEDVVHYAEP